MSGEVQIVAQCEGNKHARNDDISQTGLTLAEESTKTKDLTQAWYDHSNQI